MNASTDDGNAAGDIRRGHVVDVVTSVLSNQLRRGDFFLCASERQRHFWLGHLAAIGRLSPTLYDADPTTRSLLAVAPFGLPDKPPQRTGPGLREQLDGIGPADKVVLAAGCRERMAAVAQRYTWETALAPLVEFCRRPVPAADRLAAIPLTYSPLTAAPHAAARLIGAQRRGIAGTLRRDAALVREYLAAGGPVEVARRAAGRLRRLRRRGG